TAEARRAHLPGLCAGDAVAGAFALSEPQAGSDPAAIRTVCERTPSGGYRLRGQKLWTTSGDRAGVFLVVARNGASLGGEGLSAFVVPGGAPGLSAGRHERKMGQHGSSTVALQLDDVEVPASALLGIEGKGLRVAFSALGGGRVGIAALAIGVAEAALGAAVRYARERRQFDQPLGEFQAVRFMLADSATALDAAWLMTLAAAHRKERGLPHV